MGRDWGVGARSPGFGVRGSGLGLGLGLTVACEEAVLPLVALERDATLERLAWLGLGLGLGLGVGVGVG